MTAVPIQLLLEDINITFSKKLFVITKDQTFSFQTAVMFPLSFSFYFPILMLYGPNAESIIK
jgi:hypothetical protein